MSLSFLGMDDSTGCPECGGFELLVRPSFTSTPLVCEVCILLRKAQPAPEETWTEADSEAIRKVTEEVHAFKEGEPLVMQYPQWFEEYWAGEKKRKQVV